jgi:Ni,Fe-hydrogenase III component G
MEAKKNLTVVHLLLMDWAEHIEQVSPNRLDAYMFDIADLQPAVAGLRVKRLGYLAAITGLDPGPELDKLEILYHFCKGPLILTLRYWVPKSGAVIPSLTSFVPSAEPHERELSEMFGVEIVGYSPQRPPKHLYLPDDWPDNTYPLRKDAALSKASKMT